jgi:Mn2+/Fe2+ NRAMP family transporter
VAGPFASLLFGAGIVGTGLLAIPVLAGSAAYAVSEAFRLRTGLGRKPAEATGFYAVLVAATLLGLGLTFTPLDPIRALFWSAVLNGIAAAPVMAVVMLMTTNARIMGQFTLPLILRVIGWAGTAVMALAAIALVVYLGQVKW